MERCKCWDDCDTSLEAEVLSGTVGIVGSVGREESVVGRPLAEAKGLVGRGSC